MPVQAMHEYKNLGIGLVSGMKLKTGDSLCQLMVYRPEHKLIIVTEKGRGLVLLPDTAEKRIIEPKLGLVRDVQLIQWGRGGRCHRYVICGNRCAAGNEAGQGALS